MGNRMQSFSPLGGLARFLGQEQAKNPFLLQQRKQPASLQLLAISWPFLREKRQNPARFALLHPIKHPQGPEMG